MFVLPTHPLNEGYLIRVHTEAVGFFLQILWGRWTGDQPQEDFAKFGYWLEKKQIFFGTPCMTYGSGDIQEPMVYIWWFPNFFFLGIWQLWAIIFSSTKKLCTIDYGERKVISDRKVMECRNSKVDWTIHDLPFSRVNIWVVEFTINWPGRFQRSLDSKWKLSNLETNANIRELQRIKGLLANCNS